MICDISTAVYSLERSQKEFVVLHNGIPIPDGYTEVKEFQTPKSVIAVKTETLEALRDPGWNKFEINGELLVLHMNLPKV